MVSSTWFIALRETMIRTSSVRCNYLLHNTHEAYHIYSTDASQTVSQKFQRFLLLLQLLMRQGIDMTRKKVPVVISSFSILVLILGTESSEIQDQGPPYLARQDIFYPGECHLIQLYSANFSLGKRYTEMYHL